MIRGINIKTDRGGMSIAMDSVEMKYFLESIAISTIALCKDMEFVKVGEPNILVSSSGSAKYDKLVEDYCSGNHLLLLNSNVTILYNFVQNCVLNEQVKGLILLTEFSNRTYKLPVFKLITTALDDYMDLIKRKYAVMETVPTDIIPYNKYNKDFIKLMEKEY